MLTHSINPQSTARRITWCHNASTVLLSVRLNSRPAMDHNTSPVPSWAYIYTTAPQAVLLLCFNDLMAKKSARRNEPFGEKEVNDDGDDDEELLPDGSNNYSMSVDEMCALTGLTLNETQRLILSLTHPSAPLLQQIPSSSCLLGGMDEEDRFTHQSRSPSPPPVPTPAFYSTPPRVPRYCRY